MKILFVANRAWNFRNFRWGLIRYFQNTGNEVLAAAANDDTVGDLERNNIQFIKLNIESRTKNPFKDLMLLLRLVKLYMRYRPDVVLHFTIKPNIYGSLAAAWLKTPCINNITGLGNVFIKKGLLSRIVLFLYRISIARAARVFFQNKEDMALFRSLGLVKDGRCGLLPGSGIDTEYYRPSVSRRDGGTVVFLLAARMIWEKGIKHYVEAAEAVRREYPGTEFQLAGELGVDNPSAIPEREVTGWVDRGLVNYLGYKRDIRKLLSGVDCVVLPSYYREGVPRILLEAASMGKPIVTTDSIGCREAVEDGVNGYLCETENSADLADKIKKIIQLSEKDRENMGKKSRELAVARFDERIVIENYADAVKAVTTSMTV